MQGSSALLSVKHVLTTVIYMGNTTKDYKSIRGSFLSKQNKIALWILALLEDEWKSVEYRSQKTRNLLAFKGVARLLPENPIPEFQIMGIESIIGEGKNSAHGQRHFHLG